MEIISRKDAHAKGLKRFFTGKPCRRGHIRERNVKTGACLGCLSHYAREYSSKYDAPSDAMVKLTFHVSPDQSATIEAFIALCGVARARGIPMPLVPNADDIATVNTMIQMLQPATVAPPPVPAQVQSEPNAKHAMWVRIHGREVADQMLAQGL
jgi:hypothetical protein